jgi:hypothetical protein
VGALDVVALLVAACLDQICREPCPEKFVVKALAVMAVVPLDVAVVVQVF